MKGALPWLRLAGLALPFLTAGCMGGIVPGSDAADPSCVLLCALSREIAGAPASPPPVTPPAATAKLAANPVVARAHPAAPAHQTAAATPARRIVAHARPPSHRKPAVQVSVVPQVPAHPVEARPAAIVPPAPPPVAIAPPPAPAEPARSLSQAIPGSVGIMAPVWQGQ